MTTTPLALACGATCPASPTAGPHRWIAWRKPVLGPLATWWCAGCGADVTAPADASGCAPDLDWPALAELLAESMAS